MSEIFDPYRKWLGIPPEEQPANFYRLLGLVVFEPDPEVIAHAADRQMAHVRTFANGRYAPMSQKILNELSTARVCLLDGTKKPQYDAMLHGMGFVAGPSSAAPAPTVARPQGPIPVAVPIPPQRTSQRGPIPAQRSSPRSSPQTPVPLQGFGELPFNPNDISSSRGTPSSRPIVHSKTKNFSATPLIIGGLVLVAILVGVVIALKSSNTSDPSKTPIAHASGTNGPAAGTAKKSGEKEADKEKGKEKDKDGAKKDDKEAGKSDSGKTDAGEKTSAKGSNSAAKTSDSTTTKSAAKNPAENRPADKNATGEKLASVEKNTSTEKKGDKTPTRSSDTAVGSSSSKKTAKTPSSDPLPRAPAIPKTPDGEMPDFGPLQPSESNDTALDLTAMGIPSNASVKAAADEMRAEWKESLSKVSTRDEKIALAEKLMTQGATAKGVVARQYALLKAALGVAIESADAPTFIKVAETISESFAVDVWDAKAKAFQNAGGASATPEDLLPAIPFCDKTVRAAISAEKFNAASRIAQAGVILATRAKSPDAVKRFERTAVDAASVVQEKDAAEKAKETLVERRSDPKANLIYGSYLCFVTGDWQKGPLYLRQADDADIRRAAELELKNPFDAEKQRELGDAWFEIAQKFTSVKQTEILKRAKFWYDRAVRSLPDEEKTKVEERLKELRELLGA